VKRDTLDCELSNQQELQNLFNEAVTFHQKGQFEEAKVRYTEILTLNPLHSDALQLLGLIFLNDRQFDLALTFMDRSIHVNPNNAAVYSNRGIVLQALKRYEEALKDYDKAIALNPHFVNAYGSKSLLLLLLGDLHNGFALYEWRWKKESMLSLKREFMQPLWLGKEDINDKTILIYTEQGFGDTLQFCRYIELLNHRGAHIIFEVEMPLYSLLQPLKGIQHLVLKGADLPTFDYHCPLMSLPFALGTTLDTIPCVTPYLRADDAKMNYWKARLKSINRPKIGIVWSGSTRYKKDYYRSISLQTLLFYLPKEWEYIALQKELRDVDNETLKDASHIHFFGDELYDFADTAGLCACMDVVISVDTSVAHLAGALHKETIILLPFSPDWRWLDDRDDSPWYPSVSLLRQTAIDDWHSCLSKLPDLIQKKLSTHSDQKSFYPNTNEA